MTTNQQDTHITIQSSFSQVILSPKMRRPVLNNRRCSSPTHAKDEEQRSSPFLRVNDMGLLTPDIIEKRFRAHGFLWVRGGGRRNVASQEGLISFLDKHQSSCSTKFTVENRGSFEKDQDITPQTILDCSSTNNNQQSSFYVSTILRRRSEGDALKDLVKMLPETVLSETLVSNGGAWLFVGRHTSDGGNKRKRPLVGRAEHVDEVTHSGTWHYQMSGTKTWWIRPHTAVWGDEAGDVPDVSQILGATRQNSSSSSRGGGGGAWCLPVRVEEGDWFVLNTRIWYHRTEVEAANNWSVSVARDFYLPLKAPRNVQEGEIVLEEDDIPLDIPRSNEPNCGMAEIEENGQVSIVLIAMQDLTKGTPLTVADDDDDGEDDDGGGEYNANEMVDPRVISKQDWKKGQIVMKNDDLPDDLPRSMEPNCELDISDEDVQLRAIVPIQTGDILCILPDNDEEYEEVEVNLSTGELKHI